MRIRETKPTKLSDGRIRLPHTLNPPTNANPNIKNQKRATIPRYTHLSKTKSAARIHGMLKMLDQVQRLSTFPASVFWSGPRRLSQENRDAAPLRYAILDRNTSPDALRSDPESIFARKLINRVACCICHHGFRICFSKNHVRIKDAIPLRPSGFVPKNHLVDLIAFCVAPA